MGIFGGRRAVKVERVPDWIAAYLLDGEAPAEGTADHGDYVAAVFLAGPSGARNSWLQYEGELLARWAVQHPGTRPWAWWRFSAPEGRRQVSGEADHAGRAPRSSQGGGPAGGAQLLRARGGDVRVRGGVLCAASIC